MGDPRGRQGIGQVDAWVWRGIVGSGWHEPHKVKAAGVEARVTPGFHHQDLLGVVVESGDTG